MKGGHAISSEPTRVVTSTSSYRTKQGLTLKVDIKIGDFRTPRHPDSHLGCALDQLWSCIGDVVELLDGLEEDEA